MDNTVNFFKRSSGLCLLLFFCFNTLLLAQPGDVPISRPKYRFLEKIGLTAGVGMNILDLKRLNQRLEELGIGKVDEFLATQSLELNTGNDDIAFAVDVNVGTAFENTLVNPDSTSLNFGSFSLGMRVYKSLLRSKRLNLLAALGFRFTDLWFEYTVNTHFPAGFNTVLSNPAGSNTVRLRTTENICVPLGGRFQYLLGKQPNRKGREYLIGIDTGYVLSVIYNDWRRAGSGGVVQDMPETKPGNFYFYLTFTGLLKR
jgi:hypothetical protein